LSLVFASIHHMLSLAGAGRDEAAETLLRSLRLQAQRLQGTQPAILGEIGIPLAEAVLAAKRRQHGRVVDLLFPLRHRIALIGGSNAQRDVLAQLLIDAAIAAGRQSEALVLLRERGDSHLQSSWAAVRISRLGSENTFSGNDRRVL
jgi:hypothetical protein